MRSKLKRALFSANRVINKIESALLVAMFTIMVTIVTLNVVCRYVFNSPLFWVQEAACYILVYLIFFGASLALARSAHVVIDISAFRYPPAFKKAAQVMCDVLMYALLAVLIYYGTKLTMSNLRSFTGTLPVPTASFYVAVPISGVFMLIQYTQIVVTRKDK